MGINDRAWGQYLPFLSSSVLLSSLYSDTDSTHTTLRQWCHWKLSEPLFLTSVYWATGVYSRPAFPHKWKTALTTHMPTCHATHTVCTHPRSTILTLTCHTSSYMHLTYHTTHAKHTHTPNTHTHSVCRIYICIYNIPTFLHAIHTTHTSHYTHIQHTSATHITLPIPHIQTQMSVTLFTLHTIHTHTYPYTCHTHHRPTIHTPQTSHIHHMYAILSIHQLHCDPPHI